jgi:hypothetical protein
MDGFIRRRGVVRSAPCSDRTRASTSPYAHGKEKGREEDPQHPGDGGKGSWFWTRGLPRKGSRPPPRRGCPHRSAPPWPSLEARRACSCATDNGDWRHGAAEETVSRWIQQRTHARSRNRTHQIKVGPEIRVTTTTTTLRVN